MEGKQSMSLTGLLLCLMGCSSSASLSIFAASSLQESFFKLVDRFQEEHKQKVSLNFAGSHMLEIQIENGAQSHLFASANRLQLKNVSQEVIPFIRNTLVIITPLDSVIHTWKDLPKAKRMVIGNHNVPIGSYTRDLFQKIEKHSTKEFIQKVRANIVSQENNTRLVRAKVQLGAADAAIVYSSDAYNQNDLRVIPLPKELEIQAEYYIGTTTPHAQSQNFIDFLRSDTGTMILHNHGFAP